jgi:23S rRNA pseudouridine2605 synthase
VTELGAKADPRRDRIEVDGKRITREKPAYLVLHKPRNVVSTMSDPEGRPALKDYLGNVPARVYPVGRLDYATSGVLLFTNDGDFTQKLTHAATKVARTYVVKLDRELPEEEIGRWREGIDTEDGRTPPADVRLLRYEGGKTWLEITVTDSGQDSRRRARSARAPQHEEDGADGTRDPIRRMAEATGYVVMRLARIAFAGIEATNLRPGQWRMLTEDELKLLKRAYGVPKRTAAATAAPPASR